MTTNETFPCAVLIEQVYIENGTFSFIPKLNTSENASGDVDRGCKFSSLETHLITENFYCFFKLGSALKAGSCLKALLPQKAWFVPAFCLSG